MLTDLPNLLTLSRIVAIPLLVVLVALRQPAADLAACVLFSTAAITDYFDGKLARTRRQQSDLGRMLDPIADKLLVGAALMMLVGQGRLSAWGLYPAIVIMLREILVSGLREYLAGDPYRPAGHAARQVEDRLPDGRTRHPARRRLDCALAASVIHPGHRHRRGHAVGRRSADVVDRLGLPHRRRAPCLRAACRQPDRTPDTLTVRVLGIVGWSGSGKTTLLTKLIPLLRARGLMVSTVKHTHHGFDMDRPGKDTYRHREAGAHEVLVAAGTRWALLHEVVGPEPDLPELLARMQPVDLVLVEGYKTHPFPKLEVHRPALGKPPIWPGQPDIVAVASRRTGHRRPRAAAAERPRRDRWLDSGGLMMLCHTGGKFREVLERSA